MRNTSRFPALREGDVFLNPGELHCGYAPARIWTILGSCVSVILWHRRAKYGAMTHYLLPERVDRRDSHKGKLDARYGTDSCELVLQSLQQSGIKAGQCKARIFGGSHMMIAGKPSASAIGHRNAAVAHEFLEEHGIELISESLFGSGHRRVYFDVGTGRVWEHLARAGQHGRSSSKTGAFA